MIMIKKHSKDQDAVPPSFQKSTYHKRNSRPWKKLSARYFRHHQFEVSMNHLPSLLDFLQQKFNKIKLSGQKDRLEWNKEAEMYVMNEVLREGIQYYFQQEIKKRIQKEQFIDSKQQLLVATPQTWTNKYPNIPLKYEQIKVIPLSFMSGDFINRLMKTGFGAQSQFARNKDLARSIFKECDFLERDGRFEEPLQDGHIRSDKTLWVNLVDIDQKSFKSIYLIAQMLSALPYEFNAKTQMLAQISEGYQISFFNHQRTLHKKHLDSSTSKDKDNGKKISLMYIVLDPENEKTIPEDQIIIHGDDILHEITMEQDLLVGLMSRKSPYEIKTSGRKLFIIRYWIDGPLTDY